ncbi:Imm26 family immunity protein [Paenibacillus sp. LHD-38]|uniref:Imm26 family immunity protein n=1 Tax=Paenibacillus sp. LHD-38 TaxID=3072143 RepID=UPI00280F4B9E|nr:Imm26 family immunity protein [Paenibacillus sp. LHD-38]MDQ8734217.1 Imm26 family immunity protein [Paenibacillus sp. LHD-38]
MEIKYPFKPKTNKFLTPGQFWAIPLQNEKFACGRVIQVTKSYMASPTKTFLAGLMDWVGDAPPKSEDIAEKKTLIQGVAHIKAIHETGLQEMIIGYRPLEIDFIEPDYFRSQTGYQPEYCKLMKGLVELRPITKSEWELYPTLGAWGTDYIRQFAEIKLLR